MTELTIRRLNRVDLPAINRLRSCATTQLGIEVSRLTSEVRFGDELIAGFLRPESNKRIGIGTFDGKTLLSFMLVTIYQNAWYVSFIMSARTERRLKFNGIELMTDWMIELAESQGIYDFWYAVPYKYERAHRTAWRKHTKLLDRYTRRDVMVVNKYSRCPDDNLRERLLSGAILPVDMLIRHNTLPNELRCVELSNAKD